MAHDVVISYSRRNREIAERLLSLLQSRGLDVWYDGMIKPGNDWRDEIASAISHARIFLILFSSESNNSQELKKELAIADRRGLMIVPVRIEEVEPAGLFEYELARRQWLDIFSDWRARLPAVVDYIVEASQSPAPSAAQAPEPPQEAVKPQVRVGETPPPRRLEPQSSPPKAPPRTDTASSFARIAVWTAAMGGLLLAPLVLVLSLGLGLNGAGLLVFLYLLVQLPAAAATAPAYYLARAINWLFRAIAVWPLGMMLSPMLSTDYDLVVSLFKVAMIGSLILALGCLVFVGFALRDAFNDRASAKFWILPLIGSMVLSLTWVWQQEPIVGAAGLALCGAGYLLVARAFRVDEGRQTVP